MRKNISRRDFLKLGGLGAAGLSALALNPRSAFDYSYLSIPKRLPQFPGSEIIGRIVRCLTASTRVSTMGCAGLVYSPMMG